eukprot:2465479-Pyramimonas_sp.AAC.1
MAALFGACEQLGSLRRRLCFVVMPMRASPTRATASSLCARPRRRDSADLHCRLHPRYWCARIGRSALDLP